jgi:hypothetical protein
VRTESSRVPRISRVRDIALFTHIDDEYLGELFDKSDRQHFETLRVIYDYDGTSTNQDMAINDSQKAEPQSAAQFLRLHQVYDRMSMN